MTRAEAEAALAKYGSQRAVADVLKVSRKTIRAAIRDGYSATKTRKAGPAPSAPKAGGIPIHGKSVATARPADRYKRLFHCLARGMAYPTSTLAEEWHTAEDTVRQHARRHGALRYVELAPGEWEPCALHPETAKEYAQ
jgi:hypothetical protein